MSFNYTVEKPSGATDGFSLNANNYYESKNKGVNSSYAMAKLNFTTDGSYKLYLDCINYAETNYDFGILSEVDKTLQMSDTVDSTNVKRSFKGSSSANVQTVDYGQIANGSHYIYIKFRKDSSTSSNNDSLQFKVRTEKTLPVLESPTISLNGDILTITPVANATSYKIFSNNNLLTTSTTTTVNLSTLFSESGTYTITATALADGYLESGLSNAVTYKLQLVTLDLTTLNLSQGTHTIKVKAKGEGYEDSAFSNEVSYTVLPQLEAPTISLNGNLLSSSAVPHATSYDIYSNNTLLTTVNTVSISDFDLSGYITTEGSYTIYAVAKAANYKDSPHSNEVTYTVAPTPSGYALTVVQDNYGGTLGVRKADGTTEDISTDKTVQNVVSIDSVSYNGYPDTGTLTPNISIPFTLTEPLSITIYSACFIEGTPITLANHTYKNVEDITYDDNLLVWDFDKGEFSQAKPLWIMKQKKAIKYNHLVFSDNSELNTVEQHRIFNIEKGMFTYPMTEDTPIGTHTLNDKGEIVELVSKEVVEKEVNYYNIITNYHINLFAGHILTSCRLSNIYPIKDFKYIKDNREIIPFEKFNVPKEYYDGLRLGEQPTDINRANADYHGDNSVEDYVKRLIRDKK